MPLRRDRVDPEQYPDGVFDFVVRVVRGRIECHKSTTGPGHKTWRELARYRLTTAQAWVSIAELERYFAGPLGVLAQKLKEEQDGP